MRQCLRYDDVRGGSAAFHPPAPADLRYSVPCRVTPDVRLPNLALDRRDSGQVAAARLIPETFAQTTNIRARIIGGAPASPVRNIRLERDCRGDESTHLTCLEFDLIAELARYVERV